MSPTNFFLLLGFLSAGLCGQRTWSKTAHGAIIIVCLFGLFLLTSNGSIIDNPIKFIACLIGVLFCVGDFLDNKQSTQQSKGLLTLLAFAPYLLFSVNNLLIFCFTLLAFETGAFLGQLDLNERRLLRKDRFRFDFLLRSLTVCGVILLSSSLMDSADLSALGPLNHRLAPALPALLMILALQYLGVFTSRRTNDVQAALKHQGLSFFIYRVIAPSSCVFVAYQICEKLSFYSYKLGLLSIGFSLLIALIFSVIGNARDKDHTQKNHLIYFTLISSIFFFSKKFGPFEFLTWTIVLQGLLILYTRAPSKTLMKKVMGLIIVPGPTSLPYWALIWEGLTYTGAYRSVLTCFVAVHFLGTILSFKIGFKTMGLKSPTLDTSAWPTAILTVFVLALFIVKMIL